MLDVKKKLDEILYKKQERIAKYELKNLVEEMKDICEVKQNEDGMEVKDHIES